jgi:DivIVA domain-containing protein
MRETLSARDIERAEFTVVLRGYDRDEVEAFLRQVAEDHGRLTEALESSERHAEKPYESLGADMGELLQHARDSADDLRRRAEEDAKGVRQEAKKDAASIREQAEHEADEIRKAADYDASQRIQEAERRVRRLMEAEAEARHRLHEVRDEIGLVVERMEHAEASLTAPEPEKRGDEEGVEVEGEPVAEGDPEQNTEHFDQETSPAV